MAISLKEILKNTDFNTLDKSVQHNLLDLLEKINKIREAYGKPLLVTSGYRSKEDHIRIYKEKGIPESKIPWGSKHLSGEAIDISDPKRELQAWCLKNVALLEKIGLWCEHFDDTPNWVHFQIRPPASGNRFFHT